ncbi:ABC transporter glutamine-binding protein GlnH precursor [Bacillus pumilus]|nr:ABC transporter glutamine-binding protein GlnH precursor [Bacillus pumilus]
MKKRKRVGFMLLMSCLMVALAACGTAEKGSTDAKPRSSLEAIKKEKTIVFGVKNDTRLFGLKNPSTGDIEGFDIDIAKAIAKEMLGEKAKVEFKEVTSKTRIPLLQKGDIHAIVATMTITDERKKEVNFSDVYFEAGQSLLVKKGSDIQSIDDIKKGTKVLAVKGSTSAQNIREKAPAASVLEFENYQEAFTALKSNQGQVLTTDNAILFGMADEDSSYEVVGGTFTDEPYGIAVKKGDQELTEAMNKALKALKENGEYDNIYKKWINES